MSDDEYEEATPEEKLKIATHFILKSPNGEVNDVVSDLQKLLSNDPNILSKSTVERILRKYNTDQLFFAPDANNDMVVVSDIGEKDSSTYFDPKQNRFLKFDHHKKTFGAQVPGERKVDANTEPYRKSIESSIDKYGDESFTDGKYAAATYASPNGLITMIVTAKNLNLRNFWSGGWRSVYTLDVSKKGSKEMKGVIKLNVHYFEDGNVQLTTEFKSSVPIKVDTPEKTGPAVAAAIDKIESDFQKNLEEFYVRMHETTFKAMRRFLPLTGTKMKWKIHGHSLADEVSQFQ
uniref:F-actin-capping protein subunit alpha n=1 Tax=Hirondellea gigas TaxID=1518452 RepID=A0A6A7G5X2_9CRUS